ncbi:hypothetical protein Bca52824_034932 [Brassica carinata]|uniref:Uncharacterized protein n=1 Tax=Brassica carinata TaxID=52824 RepID=A0A8X7S1T3_BRACI|nr:hypothetical protein Bca52824_034932 [Brassica carinata]
MIRCAFKKPNETPSSYNRVPNGCNGNTSRSSSSARKRGTTKASYDFVANEAYMKRTNFMSEPKITSLSVQLPHYKHSQAFNMTLRCIGERCASK